MELLTPEEVARIIKINKRTLYYWIEKNLIPHIWINRKTIRFRAQDVEEFLNSRRDSVYDVDKIVDEIVSKLL